MAESFLDSEVEDVGGELTVMGILTKFGEDTVRKLKDSLATSGHGGGSASDLGTLEQSMRWDIEPKGDNIWTFKLVIGEDKHPNYADFINDGVQGYGGGDVKGWKKPYKSSWPNKAPESPFKFGRDSKPPYQDIERWANRRGVNPFFAYQAVFREGIRPNKFIDKVITEDLINDLSEGIASAGAKQLETFIINKFLEALD